MADPIAAIAAAVPGPFSFLSDDIVLKIFAKLEADPRDWARLSCVSARFAALICTVLYRSKCHRSLPSVVSDLLSASSGELPADAWAALHKLSVCCPGLIPAGVLLENSDFGLEREIGPDESYRLLTAGPSFSVPSPPNAAAAPPECWSLFDDLYFDTVCDASESPFPPPADDQDSIRLDQEFVKKKRRQWVGPLNSHLASGSWNLSREQGNKLLASRFRGDSLYICDWPGCVHAEEKRKYMLFRGVFKNFKRSRVWRTINDGNRVKIGLHCAFCGCKDTWDLHSAFCLRRVFGFHDDGEPVVRAYVCENGHVSGAWTERPMWVVVGDTGSCFVTRMKVFSKLEIHGSIKVSSSRSPWLKVLSLLVGEHRESLHRSTKLMKVMQAIQQGLIGLTLRVFYMLPKMNSTEDVRATKRAQHFITGWFVKPPVHGDYPKIMR